MIRRIVLTMLLLVSALLLTAVAPLGLLMAGREHASFQMETVMSAQTLALAAEKGLSGHSTGPVLTAPVVNARAPSDEVWVFNADAELKGLFGAARQENVPVPPSVIAGVLRLHIIAPVHDERTHQRPVVAGHLPGFRINVRQ